MSARKPPKPLPLNPRGSSTRHNWDSVGTIKFFTDKDDDISGLDEAMRTISLGAKQSGEANVQSPPPHASIKDSTLYNTYIEELNSQSKPDVEIAVEATSISESISPTDTLDSAVSDKVAHNYGGEPSFSQQTNKSDVSLFNNDLNVNPIVLSTSTDDFMTVDKHCPVQIHDSAEISLFTSNHVDVPLKSNVDHNLIETISPDEDSEGHSYSNALSDSPTNWKATTTVAPPTVSINPSGNNAILISTSTKTVISGMGNHHDTHIVVSNDSIKPSVNFNCDKTNVSDSAPSWLSSKMKTNSSSISGSGRTIDNNDQISNISTELICVPDSVPNSQNSISVSSPVTPLLESPQIKQRHAFATTATNTINIPSTISKKLESKSHRLPVVNKSCPRMFYTICGLGILVIYWLFTSFLWGLTIGCILTYTFITVYNYLHTRTTFPNQILCPISGLPLDHLCCSLHYRQEQEGYFQGSQWWPIYSPAMPNLPPAFINNTSNTNKCMQLRNLPNFTVPNMLEEDINKSTISGPLGNSLGFKYDNNGRPIYKGWLNEIIHYDPETHHIGKTFSVFLTLDGTQLRLQRPEHNITRRSLWNDEIPSTTAIRFRQQHIYDLCNSSVTLLPCGLVGKRLWSRKYPICITVYSEGKFKRKPERLNSLPSSTSFPNITLSTSSNKTQTEIAGLPGDNTYIPSAVGDLEFTDDTSINALQTSGKSNVKILYLFGRTCREKETWYRRLKAASLGAPLIWTPQLAVQRYLLAMDTNNSNISSPDCLHATATTILSTTVNQNDRSSDDEKPSDTNTVPNFIIGTDSNTNSTNNPTSVTSTNNISNTNSSSGSHTNYGASIPGHHEPVYVSYIRYMAKFMPANWLVRSAQALKLNVNQINCDTNMIWLNALIGRLLWDFLREPYWLERIKNKIQAKLKKIHLPNFINELTVVDIDLGSEIPVLRRVGCPYLDAHGLWFEVEVGYAGGFSFALETSVNLMRWNQKLREDKDTNYSTDNVAQNSPSNESMPKISSRFTTKMAAYISDEEDSADSTTDSELDESTTGQIPSPNINLRPGRNLSSTGLVTIGAKSGDNERGNTEDRLSNRLSPISPNRPVNLQPALPSRRRIIRIVDRITKSSYFQKAVDTKLVQRGMERLSNTPIVLQVEIQLLNGTLLVNIPPPPSDRLWYGFRPTPNLRLKTRPRVGEKVVTMSRILEWIEKKIILEFQHLVVLPNMDDLKIGLLLSDATSTKLD
ncbi:hypothetical protein MN116_001051 [Schistosoma mekongi]|uniref:SMP-LTD domain-containing protein n=1 Tax=Schistosoma mekongi TaxID=38744 RepID=A0AAE2DA31_SCHME|nr:hypothetical protein MN116_001051 [Schistosoma mekongi]